MNLTGKTALITGSAQGIGRVCAELFARRGAKVVISDVNEESCRQTCLLYTSPSPRDRTRSRMPSSA